MKWMRLCLLVLIFAFLGFLCGCAAVDTFFDADPNTPGIQTGPGSPASGIGSILSLFVPWASAAIGGVGGIYANTRKGAYVRALGSVARGVNEVRALPRNPKGKIVLTEKELMDIFSAIQDRDDTRKDVRRIVGKVENGKL